MRRARATSSLFYVDTLEYLRRGGRIGAAQALIGSALAVKPLLHVKDGKIAPLEKVRTSSRALAARGPGRRTGRRRAGRCCRAPPGEFCTCGAARGGSAGEVAAPGGAVRERSGSCRGRSRRTGMVAVVVAPRG